MAIDTNTSVNSRTITALFDTRESAQRAVADLTAAGIPSQHISQHEGSLDTNASATSAFATPSDATATPAHEKGFWESLKDFFMPEEDRYSYAEGLRRGGTLVSVSTDEANYTRVVDILDNDGAIDLDEREEQWRQEGWTGFNQGGLERDRALGGNAAMDMGGGGLAGTSPIGLAGTAGVSGTVDTVGTAGGIAGTSGSAGTAGAVPGVSTGVRADELDRVAASPRLTDSDGGLDRTYRRDTDLGRPRVRGYLFDDDVTASDNRLGDRNEGFAPAFTAADASRITEHMEVISSDGQSIGTVDHLDGPDRIKLTKNSSPDGQHHFVPFTWIDHVDTHVHLKRTLAEIKAGA